MHDCPQCEDTADLKQVDGGWYVVCPFCGFQTANFETQYAAVQAWDEVWDIIDMRSDIVAYALSKVSAKVARSYMKTSSISLIIQYLMLCNQRGDSWSTIKNGLYKQIKVTELSYDRLKRKIKS